MGFSMFPLKAEQPTVSERSPEKGQLLTEKKKEKPAQKHDNHLSTLFVFWSYYCF